MYKQWLKDLLSLSWLKRLPYRKEFFLVIFGAIISLASSFVTTIFTNKELAKKEFREKKDVYATSYLKELNQRFMLFTDLVRKDAYVNESNMDSLEIKDCSQKLEEARIIWNANNIYDIIQFHRYFGNKHDDTLNKINEAINKYAQFAEANNKDYEDTLKIKQNSILDLINSFEKNIYDDIDRKIK